MKTLLFASLLMFCFAVLHMGQFSAVDPSVSFTVFLMFHQREIFVRSYTKPLLSNKREFRWVWSSDKSIR